MTVEQHFHETNGEKREPRSIYKNQFIFYTHQQQTSKRKLKKISIIIIASKISTSNESNNNKIYRISLQRTINNIEKLNNI